MQPIVATKKSRPAVVEAGTVDDEDPAAVDTEDKGEEEKDLGTEETHDKTISICVDKGTVVLTIKSNGAVKIVA